MADDGNRYPLIKTVHPFLTSLRSELRSSVNFMNIFKSERPKSGS
jgi:hypothetical protein